MRQLEHVAIVMDGNGRWAQERNKPRLAGHRAGAKVVPKIVEKACQSGLGVLTLFAFSLENHQRPAAEVQELMTLFAESLNKDIPRLDEQNIRLRIVGDHQRFEPRTQQLIAEAMETTTDNTAMTLVVAVNYSGRWDIVQAARKVALDVEAGLYKAEEITTTHYARHLAFAPLPDPDLLIRTSGEQRISNFMLWQLAYSELYFSPVYWPDFSVEEFERAASYYVTRERRFGLVSQQVVRESHV